jgi:hypothetical protein
MISLKNTLVTLSLQEIVADEYVIVDLVLFIFLWRFLSEKNILFTFELFFWNERYS